LPKGFSADHIEFYISEQLNNDTSREELEIIFNKQISFSSLPDSEIKKLLPKYYKMDKKKGVQSSKKDIGNSDDLLTNILTEANSIGCSDIHVESYENNCRIRYRLDGKLIERYILSKDQYPAFINRIKISSHLDIAEKRLPQDGRMLFGNDEKFDIRVSILPTLYGEKAVLRLLSKDVSSIAIEELGFDEFQMKHYLESIRMPHGIILISGPTGSGKTTTLYATLKLLNKEETNITTIEDPIEYTLEGVNQVQLKESIGLTFANAIRTFLRQDPDIIMLGEIRDAETAQMAIRAALTGHLVLSTIHTNSAIGTINRLIDMGIPSFMVANTLILSVAQRLVRKLCNNCKRKVIFDPKLFPEKYIAPYSIEYHYIHQGCDECYYTGYKGRKALYELIPVDAKIADCIKQNELDVEQLIQEKKLTTLANSAFSLFSSGETSLDEIYAILTNSIK
jgi:type IV pilus assembly protein PilB